MKTVRHPRKMSFRERNIGRIGENLKHEIILVEDRDGIDPMIFERGNGSAKIIDAFAPKLGDLSSRRRIVRAQIRKAFG